MSTRGHSVFLDRLEDGFAVFETEDGDPFEVPLGLIPDGLREGQWCRLTLDADPDRTETEADAISHLRRQLRVQDDDLEI